jgi:hypothetical protein
MNVVFRMLDARGLELRRLTTSVDEDDTMEDIKRKAGIWEHYFRRLPYSMVVMSQENENGELVDFLLSPVKDNPLIGGIHGIPEEGTNDVR